MSQTNFPVHSRLTVHEGEDIYHTSEWRKSIVRYHYANDKNSTETAIYLWHKRDEEWKQKNKYTIKTAEAWDDDQPVIESLLRSRPSGDASSDFPTSDYYHVSAGETIFKTEDWWKAIVHVDEKGDYETSEVVIYVWQQHDEEWRRRQKYAVKDLDDWEEEKRLISQFIQKNDAQTTLKESSASRAGDDAQPTTGEVVEELADLEEQLRSHLGKDLISMTE